MEDNDRNSWSSKKSTRSNRSKKDLDSVEISLSQLEMMANKKKLNKKGTEISVSEIVSERLDHGNGHNANIEPSRPRTRTRDSFSSVSSSSESMDKVKRRQKVVSRENKDEDIIRQKCEYLYKLEKIYSRPNMKGLRMDMSNTLEEIKGEYYKITNDMKTERSVAFFKRMLLLGVQGIEMLNTKFDPLGVDLDGWSEAMGYSLENQEYDEVLAELYEKYKGAGQMSPEMKLIFMIISSATMFTISKKITKMDPASMLKNLMGNVGQTQSSVPQYQQQVNLPPPQQHFQQTYIPTPQHLNHSHATYRSERTETIDDMGPSKLRAPSGIHNMDDNIDINNILKTMNDRKREKDKDLEKLLDTDSSDVFKSIPLNMNKKGGKARGRPKKNTVVA